METFIIRLYYRLEVPVEMIIFPERDHGFFLGQARKALDFALYLAQPDPRPVRIIERLALATSFVTRFGQKLAGFGRPENFEHRGTPQLTRSCNE